MAFPRVIRARDRVMDGGIGSRDQVGAFGHRAEHADREADSHAHPQHRAARIADFRGRRDVRARPDRHAQDHP
jgi:hypothetical protein